MHVPSPQQKSWDEPEVRNVNWETCMGKAQQVSSASVFTGDVCKVRKIRKQDKSH